MASYDTVLFNRKSIMRSSRMQKNELSVIFLSRIWVKGTGGIWPQGASAGTDGEEYASI